jgi:hypothetical protein
MVPAVTSRRVLCPTALLPAPGRGLCVDRVISTGAFKPCDLQLSTSQKPPPEPCAQVRVLPGALAEDQQKSGADQGGCRHERAGDSLTVSRSFSLPLSSRHTSNTLPAPWWALASLPPRDRSQIGFRSPHAFLGSSGAGFGISESTAWRYVTRASKSWLPGHPPCMRPWSDWAKGISSSLTGRSSGPTVSGRSSRTTPKSTGSTA